MIEKGGEENDDGPEFGGRKERADVWDDGVEYLREEGWMKGLPGVTPRDGDNLALEGISRQ